MGGDKFNAGRSRKERKMNERETNNRIEALREAARHRLAAETAVDIVANAEKYFEFLQDNQSNDK